MDSLEKLCLCSVACNACYYRTTDFQVLNVFVLQQLVSYLGAYQLNRLHEVFIKAGVEVQRFWKRHLALHWTGACDLPRTIFSSDLILWNGAEPRRAYLESLFRKIISDLDSGTDEPLYVSKLKWLPKCRHGVCFQCSDSTPLDRNILRSELPQYAENVRVLSIAAMSKMVEYILKTPSLLKTLQCTVRRLDVHYISRRNFAATWELVRLFVQEGCITEFSLFYARLPSALLEDLLKLVSGQQAELCLGSLSGPSTEHPFGDVVTKCSSEDGARSSVEIAELGSCRFTDDVATDESRNLTGTDEVCVNETSSQASEDSVASVLDLADDNLYDIALTSSGSSAGRFRSDHHALIREDPLSLPSGNCSSRATSEPSGHNTSLPLPLRNNQSECENADGAVCDSDTSPVFGSASFSPSSAFPRRACSSFTLANFFSVDKQLRTVLVGVLKNWTTLQKLALFQVSGNCLNGPPYCCRSSGGLVKFLGERDPDASTEDLHIGREHQQKEEEDLKNFLCRAIQNDQLTHVELYDIDLGVDVVDVVLNAFRTKQNNRLMEELMLILNSQQTITNDTLFHDSTEEFLGTVCLNFNHSFTADVETCKFVMAWIRCDRALRRLYLPCFQDSSYLLEALQILESNQRIEQLHLNGNTFDATSASCLISVLRSAPSLQKLSLGDCSLTKNLIDGELFVQAITQHPKLTELNLQENYLEEIGCDLLKAVCLRKAFHFNSLNLSFNRIEGELLFRTCQEIQTELKQQQRVRFPLSELNLSGNIFRLEWRNRLVQTLMDCIDVFVALDPNLGNPAGSLADHVSQM